MVVSIGLQGLSLCLASKRYLKKQHLGFGL